MNRIYRVIWSKARHAWVVASELATGRGKNGRTVKRAALRISTQEPRLPRAWLLRAAMVAVLLAYAPARAADKYWDVNDTDPGLGGTGTWDLTIPIWGADDDGVSGPYSAWSNAAFDDAFFTGTAGTVTLGAPISVHNLNFLVHNYILNGSTLTLGGTTPTIHTPGNTTINSIIAGTAGLTKTGGGSLTLTGTNTFSGGIFLEGGTLSADDDAALGAAGNVITTRASTSVGFAVGSGPVNRTVAIGDGGTVTVTGAAGQARYTGNGNVSVAAGSMLSNDASTYTGTTRFSGCSGICTSSFTSIADLGIASSLGAPATVANGTITFNSAAQYSDNLVYLGDGDSSNRNWSIGGNGAIFRNQGTGTLTITGDVAGSGGTSFSAEGADIQLLGVISGNGNFSFGGSAGRTVTLGGANTYAGDTGIGATVIAPVLADAGADSSFGRGTGASGGLISVSGVLSYTGTGASTNRPFSFSGGTLSNNGSGALTLTGAISAPGSLTLGGAYTGADNTVSGVVSGAGTLTSNGSGTWVLTGANTRSGAVSVQNGTLRAGSAQALGTVTGVTVNGGTLDLNNFSLTAQSLTGTGGTLSLGSGTLTLSNVSGTTSYAGSITGSGGLTKLGLSTQTLTGANTYTGPTTIGAGTLNLSFAPTTGPTSNILSSSSTLNLGGGNLTVTGGANEANTQTFAGVNITGGTNNISATSATGGSVTLNLGAINRTGGLVDFDLPTAGNITTSNTTLGGWATINNGSSYAKIVGGNIVAFTASDYTVQNNAALWADNQFITDSSTGFTGTMDSADGTLQLGGLRYTAARSTTVNIASGDTLGIDGTILVAPSVGGFNQTISGGSLTGPLGGGTLGIQQNSTGTFTINSQIVDNGGVVGFTKAGTGTVTLTAANSTYSGPTVVSQGTLAVASIANGGVASSIGDSSAASSNLVLEGGTLRYTGAGATSDRGFTLARSGPITGGTIDIQNAAADLEFSGVVTSADGASLTKTGAGTLSLTNATNDYTGVTTINAGTLSVSTLANGGAVSGMGASSNASSNLVLAGGTLQYTGGTVSSDRGFTLSSGTSGIDVTDSGTTLDLSGTAAGGGALRKDGAGTLVLAGTNAYTGATTVNAGTLRAGSTDAFSSNVMTLTNAAAVTLDLAGFDNTVGSLAGGGTSGGNVTLGAATLTLDGTNGTYSGAISGSGGLIKGSSGTQTMVGCNHTYTGATTLSGFLSVDCLRNGSLASGIGASSNAASNLVFNAGTLIYTGGSIGIDRGFTLTGSGAIDVTAGATTLSFSGSVVGAGGLLVKRGAGTLVLSGSNTYTGITLLEGGTLRAGSNAALGNSTGIRMDGANTTLDLAGFDHTVAYLHEASSTANRNVALGGATLTINSGDGTYSGVISGSGSLVKSVGGTQTLSGCNNSYTGSTRITAGALTVNCLSDGGANSSIGNSGTAASNLYINGALTYVGTGSTTNRQFTMGTAGAVLASSGSGAVNFTSAAPITIDSTAASRTLTLRGTNTDNNILAAQINNGSSGSVRVTKTDAGTWVLTNENSAYTGITRIDGGVLSVSKLADGGFASSIGASGTAASNLVIGNDSTLRYTGSSDSSTNRQFTLSQGVTFIESSGTGALKFTSTANVGLSGTGDRTIALGGTNTGANTMGGTITDAGAGKTTLAKNDSGTWILTGNNTYTGNTVVNDGNLIIGNGGTTGNAGAGNVIVDSAASTLSINRSDAFDFNGTLSGPGTLAQIGTGTTRLTSATNSIGATRISAGTLEIEAGGALTTTTVAMNGTSTLDVEGTVQASGGTAAVFTGDAGASTIHVDAGGTLRASGDLGDGSDVLNVTGTLDSGAGTLSLGAGDDTFMLNDGAVVSGAVDAGSAATADTLQINNALARTFEGTGFSSFERLVKQNAGILTLTGTQTYSVGTQVTSGTLDVDGTVSTGAVALADSTTLNIDGTLQGVGAAPAAIAGSSGANTILVNTDATLNANGDLGDGGDTLTLGGELDTGASALSLGAGDDTLILNDGAAISGSINGGAAVNQDTVQANNAAALTLSGSNVGGFEDLIKSNTGVLTLTGSHVYSEDVAIVGGVLDVDGSLETPLITVGSTLNVDGTVQAIGGGPTSLSGTALVNTVLVNTGGVLRAAGNLAGGNDVVTLGGTLDTGAGTLDLGSGDDTLTLSDGAVIGGLGVDGGTATTADRVILDNASALTFDGGRTAGFETLIKQNGGSATMTGTQTFSAGTTLSGGALDIDGTLQTPTMSLADGTTLNVDGTVQAAGATQAAITGSSGVNTVTVNDSGTLLATGDLGDGADVLDVSGTLDTGPGGLSLGDGNDTFVVHDDANVSGTVDGGAGIDSRVYDINLTANVGALLGFEGLTKSGSGTLNINGPGSTSLAEVEVLGGTLNIAAGGDVAGVQTTTVASGSTVTVDGTYAGSGGNDTFTVAGTVGGAGSINLGTGDDVLTLQDGAALNMTIDAGGDTAGDSVVLDNSAALTFGGANVTGFEALVKENTGTATLTGAHTYDSATIDGGTLHVDGTLQSATVGLANGTTLNVDGSVQAAGGTQAAITGTTGVNTVIVNAGGNLLATGDLGDGNDVLDVAGTLDTGGGTFSLGAGDDTFVVHNTTAVIGTLDAGAGNDLLNVNVSAGNLVPLGSTTGFESLGKSGLGALEINGASDFVDVQVQAGLLDVTASGSIEAQSATVSAGATLNVDGTFQFTSGADELTVAGNVTGNGSIDLLDGDDALTLMDGADLSALTTALNGGAGNDTLTANIATSATLGGVAGFETLTKEGAGTLNIAGPASSTFNTALVQGGVLDVEAGATVSNVSATSVASGAALNVDGSYAGSGANDTFIVAGTVSGAGTIGLGAGDDVLTLRDGAAVNIAIDAGSEATGDRVVLDNAVAFALDSADVTGFEQLVKQNAGTATLVGTHSYDSAAIDGGTVVVDGTLETAAANLADGTTLHVDGTMQAAGGASSAITGSTGVNTVTVAAGASMLATGDLGDGADVLDIAGTLDTGGGSFDLGAGDDTFIIHDGTNVLGTVSGGAGLDTRIYDIAGVANVGALQEFEALTKRNTGTLNIDGPGVTTDLVEVSVEGGTLNISAAGNVAGVQTTTIASGTTLNVDGAYAGGAGDDTFTVAGTISGAGSIDLGTGDDVLTLQDGAAVNVVIDAGGETAGDRVVLDNAAALTFDGTNVTGFEALVKQNAGTATLAGAQAYDSARIDGGTLQVDGTLDTATVALADDTTLSINGTVQAAGAAQTALAGTAGSNTVVVNTGATLLATGDLGDGNDVLDIGGTLDVGGGTFSLGDGDDTFTVHDNTVVNGTIDGGDGLDTRSYDINLTADVGELVGFEGLTKTGTGVLNLNGPDSSTLAEVDVLGGTLNVAAGGGIDGITSATVATGATLNLGGGFAFTSGADTLTVGGTIAGAGTVDLLDGDDQLTLLDGADFTGLAAAVDGGAGNDLLMANIVTSATLGGVTGFENLTKQGAGSLDISGPSASIFNTVLVEEGLLDVIAGASVEAQTATVDEGATLNVDGDFLFTAGSDTFTVAGNVSGLGAVDMLDGDDQLTLLDGADLSGLASSLDGGSGADTLTADIATQATLGGATGFETLIKEGVGQVTIAGPADSMFQTVLVREGELEVAAGALVDPQTTAVDAGATITIDGTYHGTTDADTFTLSGTLAGNGTVDLLEGDDVLTINTGATVPFTGTFDAAAETADRLVLAGAGEGTFDASSIGPVFRNFDEFRKEGTGTWRLTGSGSNDWTVAEGTLIGDSATFGGDIDDAATVIFDQADDGSFDGVLSGNGTLIKLNSGTLAITATNTFTGNTQITAGTLQVDGTLPGALTVESGGTLSGTGTVGSVTALAGGFVAPGTAALPFGTLTIAGDYGGGGTVRINTVLGNEQSDTGRLAIEGSTSGTSAVLINRWSGDGAMTAGDGIKVIQVDGASAPDSFQLAQPVQAGAYEYLLYQGGSADANDWYLRSELTDSPNEPEVPAFRPGVAGYALGHQANLEYGFTALGDLRARVGDERRAVAGEQEPLADAWMRVYTHELDISGTRFATEDLQMSTLQFGTDLTAYEAGTGTAHVGMLASVGSSSAAFVDKARALAGFGARAGDVETDAMGVGMYWTRYLASGAYLDVSGQALHYRNRYHDQYLAASEQSGWGGTISAEIGSAIALGRSWLIEPQLQLAYQRLELGDLNDGASDIADIKDDALRGRAAVRLSRVRTSWLGMTDASPYLGFGIQRDFEDAAAVTIGGTRIADEMPDTTGDVSVGFTGYVLSDVELHLDVRYQDATRGERDGVRANFGFRMSF